MKWLTFEIQRSPGFRLNLIDIGLILLLAGLSAWLYFIFSTLSLFLVPLYLGFSFFLFCNVFRIENRLEIFWYIPFILIAVFCLYSVNLKLFWLLVLMILEPIKVILIVYHVVKGPYVGVLSKYR